MVPTSRPVAALTSVGLIELVHLDHVPQFDALDEQLSDAITAFDPHRFGRIEVDEIDPDLPPVPGVDGARGVDDGETSTRGQARPGVHEPHVPVRDRDGDSCAHERPVPGRELAVLGGVQVDPRIGRVCPDRDREPGVQPPQAQHPDGSCAVPGFLHVVAALLPGLARMIDSLDAVIEDDLRPPPDRAPRPVHSERLRVPVWWWVALAAGTAIALALAVVVGAQWWMWILAVIAPALLAWLFVTVGRERIEVESDGQGGGTLYAGRARLPFDAISRSAVVPATAKQSAMGRQLDPEAFVVHRGYIPTMVIVVLDDPLDPTPYWLISTRDPEGLAAALPDNQYS